MYSVLLNETRFQIEDEVIGARCRFDGFLREARLRIFWVRGIADTGTNMQCQSYFPLHFPHGDFNVNSNSSTLLKHIENVTLKAGNSNTGLSAWPGSRGQRAFDKQLLCQIILKHEVMFRDQVHELHRLYRRQKELMDEIKRKEQFMKHLHLEAQWSNPSTSQITSKCTPDTSHSLPFTSLACSRPSTSDTAYKGKKIQRKLLDLQLPADVYIDSEEESLNDAKVAKVPASAIDDVNNSVSNVAPKIDARALLVSDGLSHESHSKKSIELTDLSEPIQVGEASAVKDNCGCKLSGNWDLMFQLMSKGMHDCKQNERELIFCAGVPEPANIVKTQKWMPNDDGAGHRGSNLNSFYWDPVTENFPKSHLQMEHSHVHTLSLPDLAKSNDLYGNQRENFCSELSGTNDVLFSNKKQDLLSISHQPTTERIASLSSKANSELPSFSFSINSSCKLSQNPIVVQAHPCNGTKMPSSSSSLNHSSNNSFVPDHLSCQKHGNLSDFIDLNATEVPSFNFIPSMDAPPKSVCQENHSAAAQEARIKNSLGKFPCLTDLYCSSQQDVVRDDWPQAMPAFSQVYSSCVFDANQKQNHGNGSPDNEMIPEPLTFNGHHSSNEGILAGTFSNSMDGQVMGKGKKAELFDINLPFDHTIALEKPAIEGVLVANSNRQLGHVDLNMHVADDGAPQSLSSLCQIALDIKLEVPISADTKEHLSPRDTPKSCQSAINLKVSAAEDGDLREELAEIAAKAIVSISLSKARVNLESSVSDKFGASDNGYLEWFAGVISSMEPENDLVTLDSNDSSDIKVFPLSDGIDYFEVMTLKLTEMKVEEYGCHNIVPNEEGILTASFHSCQPRKVRTRRPKRKDFQREVLPSLISLTRHEVTEDIQIIQGLMEAVGTPWQKGTTKRKADRNRKPRARKQLCFPASGARAGSPLKPLTAASVPDLKDRSLNWGKITTRRRGQRCRARDPTSLGRACWLQNWGMIL
ncbi:hypothetical protein Nepgr_033391 [Nepenthes gracilis]|uniref:Uncharacterized protein n=1 Tax=Nepenthes gracilis TaxID=150966 RepID=A0AAD3TMJ6_NEPGR|nr:hypothetical protein Nepgr_033391 [Nepenthes gracilis]